MNSQARFEAVADQGALDQAIQSSTDGPVVVFLDDPFCPISARAHQEVERVPATVWRIDVSEQHDLSRAVEQRSGVRHESPQVIIFREGRASWSASHFSITAAAVTQALELAPQA